MENMTLAGWGMLIGFIGLMIVAFSVGTSVIETELSRNKRSNHKISMIIYRCGFLIGSAGGIVMFLGIVWILIKDIFMR